MKKVFSMISVLILITIFFAGCGIFRTEEPSDMESSSETSETTTDKESKIQESEKSEPEKIGKLFQNSFGKLRNSNSCYINVKMTVETFSVSSDNTDSGLTDYEYAIALDKKKKIAALSFNSFARCVVKNKQSYTINDDSETCTISSYTLGEEYFAEQYTADIYLGMADNMTFSESGTTHYQLSSESDSSEVQYEKYQLSHSENSSDNITVTYYFKASRPYAEIMETTNGKTIFEFVAVTDQIEDEKIFDIPDNYYTEESSSDNEETSIIEESVVTQLSVPESSTVSYQSSNSSGKPSTAEKSESSKTASSGSQNNHTRR